VIRVEVCDARRTPFPDKHFHAVVTSPPYYKLRRYGAGAGEVGAEQTLPEYVASLVEVFRECRRVLRDDGVAWVNLGDTYEDKELLLVPAQVALALHADGWVLRADVPWLKSNGMPNSQRDRPSVTHETVYLLAKRERYFFDLDAVRRAGDGEDNRKSEAERAGTKHRTGDAHHGGESLSLGKHRAERAWRTSDPAFDSLEDLRDYLAHVSRAAGAGGLLRSPEGTPLALPVPTEPSGLRHFAMMPPNLVADLVRSATGEAGCCAACGAPRVRVVEKSSDLQRTKAQNAETRGVSAAGRRAEVALNAVRITKTLGWDPSCACGAPIVPCRVFDPFSGAGTTVSVADALGRDGYGAELNPDYAALTDARREEVRAALARGEERRKTPQEKKFAEKLRRAVRAKRSESK